MMTDGNATTDSKDMNKSNPDDSDKELQSIVVDCILMENISEQWSDVAGLKDVKKALTEAVIPIQFPHSLEGRHIPCKRILLIGAPGTGKTYLAKAFATQASNASYFFISCSDLISKWIGKSDKLIRSIFEAALARKPSIICFDDLDMLCSLRLDNENVRKIKLEFLTSMYKMGSSDEIVVLGATNVPWLLDCEIRKCFEKRVYVPLPEENARLTILKHHLGDAFSNFTEDSWRTIANNTKGFTGADIVLVVRDALMQPVRTIQSSTHFRKTTRTFPHSKETICDDLLTPCSPGDPGAIEMTWMDIPSEKLYVAPVTTENILKSVSTTQPTISEDYMKQLDKFMEVYGQCG